MQNTLISMYPRLEEPLRLKERLDLQSIRRFSSTCHFFNNQFKNEMLIKKLLNYTVLGRLDKVDEILKANPELALGKSIITDLSERTFYQITAFQYAVWSLDVDMWNLFLKYLDSPTALSQLQSLEASHENYSKHGMHYDIAPLIAKTRTYLDNYRNWNEGKRCQYWQKEVGSEQRQCPAWLIYAWCEQGMDVAWTKNQAVKKITRQYDKAQLSWWFTKEYMNGKGTGSNVGRMARNWRSCLFYIYY